MINKKEAIIIKYLADSKNYVTSKELATLLDVSSKTINRYIASMNTSLKKYNLEIMSSRGLGYNLAGKKNDITTLLEIVNKSINGVEKVDSLETRISSAISMFINNQYVSIDNMSEELNLSNASTSKLFAKVKEVVSKYNITINSKPCYGSYLIGEEKQVRLLIMDYLITISDNRQVNVDLDNISKKDINEVEEIILKHLASNNLIMSDKDFNLLLIKFIISLSRAKRESEIHIENKIQDRNYYIIKNIAEDISNLTSISLDDSEIHYILSYLRTILTSYRNEESDIDARIDKTIKKALVDILIISGNDYREDEEFLKAIHSHTNRMLSRVFEDVRVENPLMNQIKGNLPMEFNLAVFLSEKIEEEFNIKLNENELAYIAVHFAVSTEKMKKARQKNVCIVCNYGIGTGELLAEKIRQKMQNVNIIGVYPLLYLDKLYLEDVDFIISTVPIKRAKKPIIHVDNIFSDDVLKNIESKMEDEINRKEIFKSMFKEDLFYKLNLSTKEEVMTYITKDMKDNGYISEKSIEQIFEREAASSTEIGNLVAIPHTIMTDEKKSVICVVSLDRPIIWHKREVQLVLMVFFNKEERENAPIFRKLYHLFKDENEVKNIFKISDYKKFMDIIF